MQDHRVPWLRAALRASLLLALAGSLAGCVSDGQGPVAMEQSAGATTVAFESIDGPPPQVFERMVGMIDSESKLRHVAVVSREAPATYRVRSYLAAQVQRGRTSIAWVWDVYDRNHQRTLRLSGEEASGKAGSDAWASADDVVLRRIAQAGLGGLSGIINGGAPTETPAEPAAAPEPVVAAADEPASPSHETSKALSFAAR